MQKFIQILYQFFHFQIKVIKIYLKTLHKDTPRWYYQLENILWHLWLYRNSWIMFSSNFFLSSLDNDFSIHICYLTFYFNILNYLMPQHIVTKMMMMMMRGKSFQYKLIINKAQPHSSSNKWVSLCSFL